MLKLLDRIPVPILVALMGSCFCASVIFAFYAAGLPS